MRVCSVAPTAPGPRRAGAKSPTSCSRRPASCVVIPRWRPVPPRSSSTCTSPRISRTSNAGDAATTEYEQAVSHQVSVINEDLGRGDFFLCASERQRDFWLGALSHAGPREPGHLRRRPDAAPPRSTSCPSASPPSRPSPAGPVLRRHFPAIGADDPVVVWGGGVYDWFDPVSLVRAVDRVRSRIPDVRLVFLGMSNPNPDIAEMARAVELRSRQRRARRSRGSTVFFNDAVGPVSRLGELSPRRRRRGEHPPRQPRDAVLVPHPHSRLPVGAPTHDPHRW